MIGWIAEDHEGSRGGDKILFRLLTAAAVVVLVTISSWSETALAAAPKADEIATAKAAFKAAEAGKWKAAYEDADKAADPLLRKILVWIDYTSPDTTGTFEEISRFAKQNPDWPSHYLMLRRAEESLAPSVDDKVVLGWFSHHDPVSADGAMRYAAALLAAGQEQKARSVLRETWINRFLGRTQAKTFYRTYHRYLTPEDNWQRLDRLIWLQQAGAARRMLRLVEPGHRALAEARIRLMTNRGAVDHAIRQVPKSLKNDPGLIYERVRWRRRKGRWEQAVELLDRAKLPSHPAHAERWWTERALLARRALEAGYVSEAYRIARNHGLTDGAGFAAGEWLAGWISLRFLQDDKVALAHFTRMYEGVQYPISLARAAYWCGRAADALGDPVRTTVWYGRAAQYPTTYYGQLALARLGRPVTIPAQTDPPAAMVKDFEADDLVKVVRLLGRLGQDDLQRTFFMALARVKDKPGWHALAANLAIAEKRPDLAVSLARKQLLEGPTLARDGYPDFDGLATRPDKDGSIETALLLALIRQESAFRVDAVSPAGARGLMQLLPSTAKALAKRLKIHYVRKRLTKDPEYNMKLGKAHLMELLERFNGSYVLALAGYNAGPSRVADWIDENGDPRDGSVDSIDWVEMIPFDETRNYVQRVLEALQIYRLKFGDNTEVAQSLESDLH